MRAKPRQRPQTASIEHLTQRLGEVRKKAALSAISSPQLVTAGDVQEAGVDLRDLHVHVVSQILQKVPYFRNLSKL